MHRALDLAARALGRTAPNPLVGAVVVDATGRVVGEGFHRRCGEPHAEQLALAEAGARARGATLVCTLEPCAHHGHTPPCVDAIVDAGVRRVVMATRDPDPRVDGRGVAALRRAGVETSVGAMADAALALNLPYLHDRLGDPATVTLKIAVTADGCVSSAPGRRDTITGLEARRHVHALRAGHDAIVVGVETLRVDRPRLDCRYLEADAPEHEPVPVVLDTMLRSPVPNRWSALGRPWLVACADDAPPEREASLRAAGARVLRCRRGAGGVDVADVVRRLADAGLRRILVEGGPSVLESFLGAGRWHALYRYVAPVTFGNGVHAARDGRPDPGEGVCVAAGTLGADRVECWLATRERDRLRARLVRQ